MRNPDNSVGNIGLGALFDSHIRFHVGGYIVVQNADELLESVEELKKYLKPKNSHDLSQLQILQSICIAIHEIRQSPQNKKQIAYQSMYYTVLIDGEDAPISQRMIGAEVSVARKQVTKMLEAQGERERRRTILKEIEEKRRRERQIQRKSSRKANSDDEAESVVTAQPDASVNMPSSAHSLEERSTPSENPENDRFDEEDITTASEENRDGTDARKVQNNSQIYEDVSRMQRREKQPQRFSAEDLLNILLTKFQLKPNERTIVLELGTRFAGSIYAEDDFNTKLIFDVEIFNEAFSLLMKKIDEHAELRNVLIALGACVIQFCNPTENKSKQYLQLLQAKNSA